MKIALCFFGLIGSKTGKSYDKLGGTSEVLKKCASSFQDHIINKNNVDIFFHTWDQEFEEELVKHYKPKLFKTEPQKIFSNTVPGPKKRIQAHYSRWYSAKHVNNLKSKYENKNNFKYDLVLSTRFDIVWTTDIIFNNLNKDIFYIPGTTKHQKPWGWPHPICNNEINDMWFISNSKNMDDFAQLYDNINPYIQNEKCPTYLGISNHMLSKHHLNKLNLLSKTNPIFLGPELPNSSGYSDYQLYKQYITKIPTLGLKLED